MIFETASLEDVFVIHTEPVEDERGAFAQIFGEDEFVARGIDPHVAQCSVSRNPQQGTLRGLHLQLPPHEETKLVRCTNGMIFDVAVDLRLSSPTFGAYESTNLSDVNQLALLMPPGVAHGFLTLKPNTDVWYQMSTRFAPEFASGIRWDDSNLGINWPKTSNLIISDQDQSLPGLDYWAFQ